MARKQSSRLGKFIPSKRQRGLLLGLLAFGGLAAVSADWLVKEASYPVNFVRLEGNLRYIDRAEIKAEIEPLFANGFLRLDMAAINESVQALPWVESVRIARIWPDTLQIEMKEQVPYLEWGEGSYLNKEGEKFSSAGRTVAKKLPKIIGNEGQEKLLLLQYEKINKALAQQDVKINVFRVTDRQAWQLELENGTTILLGRDKPAEAFERLIHSVSLLGSERLQRIDMRYPNGFAVQWKETELEKIGMNRFVQVINNV